MTYARLLDNKKVQIVIVIVLYWPLQKETKNVRIHYTKSAKKEYTNEWYTEQNKLNIAKTKTIKQLYLSVTS